MRSATLLAFVDWRPSAVKSTIVYCLGLAAGMRLAPPPRACRGCPFTKYVTSDAVLPCRPWQAVRRRVWAQRQPLVGGYMQNPWLWL